MKESGGAKIITGSIEILPIAKSFEEKARGLILDGLLERFGYIDVTLNPDLKDIMSTYHNIGHVFLVGEELVATGVLTNRIVWGEFYVCR
ncbi:hypothetical protein ACFS6F_09945 [Halobacillus naozhouensis]|uniref:hypothetical protein n=1 Tax=Halobacillus naozhouensis TaxID=554880 RepID=UPI003641D5FC